MTTETNSQVWVPDIKPITPNTKFRFIQHFLRVRFERDIINTLEQRRRVQIIELKRSNLPSVQLRNHWGIEHTELDFIILNQNEQSELEKAPEPTVMRYGSLDSSQYPHPIFLLRRIIHNRSIRYIKSNHVTAKADSSTESWIPTPPSVIKEKLIPNIEFDQNTIESVGFVLYSGENGILFRTLANHSNISEQAIRGKIYPVRRISK